MAKTDAEILDGSPIEITFNGTTYTWRPLNRRKQRRVRADLLAIMGVAVDGQGGTDMMLASAGMKATNMVLDFCEDHNPAMSADMDEIESYIAKDPQSGFSEVMQDIFKPLFEAWLKPWLVSEDSDEPADSKKKTSTKSPRSTKG